MKSLPNYLSIFRICLVPVFVFAFIFDDKDYKLYAAIVLVIANATDVLDGIIARKYDAQSDLGRILDPLGDKLINLTALVCITSMRPVLLWAAIIFVVKEILMGLGGLIIKKIIKIDIPPSHFIGKAATVAFFLVCAAFLVLPFISDCLAVVFVSIAMVLTLSAFALYIFTFISIIKQYKSRQDT